ncbi:MAG: NTP transferase domain-containing protein, partial [Acidimicrobiales bacterium]
MNVWGIVLAAGAGARFGTPKQFEKLGSRRIVDWSLDSARASCANTVLVLVASALEEKWPATCVVKGGS